METKLTKPCYKQVLTKLFDENGTKYKLIVRIGLNDECNNKIYTWSITGDLYHQARNNKWVCDNSGCIHDIILKHLPKLEMFVKLHLSDIYGAPLYAVANGFYYLRNCDKSATIKYLRLEENEYEKLLIAIDDKLYFHFLLYHLGIVSRWNEESDLAIKRLEHYINLPINKNVYDYESMRPHIRPLSKDDIKTINERLDQDYYSDKNIQLRKDKQLEKYRQELKDQYYDCIKNLENAYKINLYILNYFGRPDINYSYLTTNKCVFNDNIISKRKITQEEYVNFINDLDYSKLPENIKFDIK